MREGTALNDRFGDERAATFGQALPGLVADLTRRWGLSVEGALFTGATAVVIPVTTRSAASAVIKVSPDAEFLTRQTSMLRHLASTGRVPRVLEEDRAAGAVLMEQVVPGLTLDDSRATPPTPQDWAQLLADLHATASEGVTDLLRLRCEDMFRRIGARQALERVNAHISRDLWGQAVQECLSLLETDRGPVVIHGDLHLGNVLRSDAHGLVVIDPKLCVGDPCFDMVDFVVTTGTADEMTARALELAPLLGIDSDRLLRWCRVNAVITAISRTTWSGPDEWTRNLLEFAQRQ